MARSFKFEPFWKKNKSRRIDKETKTSLKNGLLKTIDTEENTDDYLQSIGYATMFFLGVVLFGSSCVSTKKLAMDQEKSSQYAQKLDDCEDMYAAVYSNNKELTKSILELENQLANERDKYNLMEQQIEYF